jgi:hypothetical protein
LTENPLRKDIYKDMNVEAAQSPGPGHDIFPCTSMFDISNKAPRRLSEFGNPSGLRKKKYNQITSRMPTHSVFVVDLERKLVGDEYRLAPGSRDYI